MAGMGEGVPCKWEGRKPSVGKGGKRRMIVRRVRGKERAETIVQLSKEAVIEGVRIWHSIFLKTLKVHRKKVILCLIECPAGRESILHRALASVFLVWPEGWGMRVGIRRCSMFASQAFCSAIQTLFARLGHKIVFFFRSSLHKKRVFL